jgi:hypothetical protein
VPEWESTFYFRRIELITSFKNLDKWQHTGDGMRGGVLLTKLSRHWPNLNLVNVSSSLWNYAKGWKYEDERPFRSSARRTLTHRFSVKWNQVQSLLD